MYIHEPCTGGGGVVVCNGFEKIHTNILMKIRETLIKGTVQRDGSGRN
jgi:hypothetical protein